MSVVLESRKSIELLRESVERCRQMRLSMVEDVNCFADVCESARIVAWNAMQTRLESPADFIEVYMEAAEVGIQGFQSARYHYAFNAFDRIRDLVALRANSDRSISLSAKVSLVVTWLWREFRRESIARQDSSYGFIELGALCEAASKLVSDFGGNQDSFLNDKLDELGGMIRQTQDKILLKSSASQIFGEIEARIMNRSRADDSISWDREISYVLKNNVAFPRPDYPIIFNELQPYKSAVRSSDDGVLEFQDKQDALIIDKEDSMFGDRRIDPSQAKVPEQQTIDGIDFSLLEGEEHPHIAYELVKANGSRYAVPLLSATSYEELIRRAEGNPEILSKAFFVNRDELTSDSSFTPEAAEYW